MPSATYWLFGEAILSEKQITCDHQGYYRELCPIILGHTYGRERALVFQFGGQSSQGLSPGGNWKFLELSQVEHAKMRDGRWHEGGGHSRPQAGGD